MYKIAIVNSHPAIMFAGQELKKYLRMMMPRCGGIDPNFDPQAKEGFRLGLMADFNLPTTASVSELDDEIYIAADAQGGILAGSNPRAVLLAVYRYLKKQGCNWLFPGPDGERIPIIDELKPVEYSHLATFRYRGQCNEGAESQPQMMNAIDFTPKVGLNTFMIEGDSPQGYYKHFYSHQYSSLEDEHAPSFNTALQWKRACEAEIERRDMRFHDFGHGWTAWPFGFRNCRHLSEEERLEEYKKEKYQKHATLIYGRRGLFRDGYNLNSNNCLSNPETRTIMADAVVDYCTKQDNVNYVHVWLSDAPNSHCECEECKKKHPSDWYIMMLNEVDEKLTARGIQNKIAFIAYLDTFWAPKEERFNNEDRFLLLFAPIKRYYTKNYNTPIDTEHLMEYKRNELIQPRNMNEALGYLNKWQQVFHGDCFCYEYYFWRACYFDMGSRMLARTIWEDLRGLPRHNLKGIVADGSQRAYFPNGFQFYVYGEMQYDNTRSFEELEEEYYSAAYGKDWRLVADYLDRIDQKADFLYLAGHNSVKEEDRHVNPALSESFAEIPAIVDEFLPTIRAHLETEHRCEYVSWSLLEWHGKFLKGYAKAASLRAKEQNEEALAVFEELQKTMEPLDLLRHDCYDHFAAMNALNSIFKIRK